MRIDNTHNTCGKIMYTSEREAGEILFKCRTVSKRSKIPKRKYYCKECQGWHVTSQKNKSEF